MAGDGMLFTSRRTILTSSLIALAACGGTYRAPLPPVPRSAAPVAASFGKVWDATIDVFAERGISIETLDRNSGLIVPSGRDHFEGSSGAEYFYLADCGSAAFINSAKYNVVVRGDSLKATVQVRAFYRSQLVGECSSTGAFENAMEALIAAKAEGRPMPVVAGARESTNLSPICESPASVQREGTDLVATIKVRSSGTCKPYTCTYKGAAMRTKPEDADAKCKESFLSRKE